MELPAPETQKHPSAGGPYVPQWPLILFFQHVEDMSLGTQEEHVGVAPLPSPSVLPIAPFQAWGLGTLVPRDKRLPGDRMTVPANFKLGHCLLTLDSF